MNKEVFFVIGSLGGKGWGGAHRVICILANYLAEKGYPVTIIVWRDSPVDYPLNQAINLIWLHCNVKKEIDMIEPCIKTRKILRQHPGAYLYAFMSRMATYARIYTTGLSIKVIGSERTDPRTEPHNAIFRLIRDHVFGFMYKTVYQTPDALAYFPKRAQKNGCVIPNPITPNLPKRFEGIRRKEFVTFCRIDKQKNLPMMIDSFVQVHSKYPEYKLRIYGTGLIETEIKDYIKKKQADKYIIMEGFASKVHESILDCAGFLSSSDYEGLSNSMLEAMAIGLPCVCTDCPIGGAHMMIQDGVNGLLVPVGDSNAMAAAIIRLIENVDLETRLSIEAEKVKQFLDENIICKKWESLLYEENEI